MPLEDNRPYRPGVGLMIFNQKGEVFIGERFGQSGAWQMPQGGIDDEDGTSLNVTIYRELYEETGIDKSRVEILKITDDWLYYDLPEHLSNKIWDAQYKGQKQKWAALLFNGHDAEVNLATHRHQEFQDWQWSPVERALELIVPFKRHTYEAALKEFSGIIEQIRKEA